MMNTDEFRKALRPVKRRIRRNRLLRGSAAGLAAGLSAAAGLQAVSFFVPVPDKWLWSAGISAAAVLITAAGNALRPVKDMAAAEAADACGLEERAVTALETAGGDTPACRLLHADACDALGKLDVRKIRPGSAGKALLAALCCAVLSGALLLIPNGQDAEADRQRVLNKTLREGREAITRATEEDEETLPGEKKSELRKITEELNRELGESRDAADALVALDKAEQRLEQMREQTAGDAAAADGRTGEGGDGKDGKGGTAEEKQSAGTAAQTGQAGQEGAADSTVNPSQAQMKTLQALNALKSAVNPSAVRMQSYTGLALTGAQGMQNGPGSDGAAGIGGQNTGQQAGSGAGEGSTNEEQEGGGSHSGVHVQGNREPKYKETEYETIYDPEHIDKAVQDTATEEKRLSDEGSVQIGTGPGRGNAEGDVPWGEALQEYAETEARAAERENLTTREREWVNEYYRLLTEQR